jgi:hypothetical protein
LANGVPSHDTFSRLFRQLDPAQFRMAFQRFTARFSEQCQGVVAIDGKALRRSFDRASPKSALHKFSARGCEQRLVRAQIPTDAKSNEITAVPKLLAMLSLKGTIVLNFAAAGGYPTNRQGDPFNGGETLWRRSRPPLFHRLSRRDL